MTSTTTTIPDALQPTKALLFDVFGTVVDWRTSVTNELTTRARQKLADPQNAPLSAPARAGLGAVDWPAFAQQWRDSYGRFTRTFVPGTTPWRDIDAHHLSSLRELLESHGLSGEEVFSDAEVLDLSRAWHRLAPWPDVVEGLGTLGTRYVTSTLSNGNRALLEDLQEFGDLGFHRLVSSADFEAYKPHPSVYLGAAAQLGFDVQQCALVAAHLGDLKAAKSLGMGAIYVERLREEDFSAEEVEEARKWVDLWIAEDEGGFVEVARRLGISQS